MEDDRGHAWHLFVVHLPDNSVADRGRFIDELASRGVGTSVHYRPLHLMTHWAPPDRSTAGSQPIDPGNTFRGADAWYRGCVSLPLFPSMTEAEFDTVCTAVENALEACSLPSKPR